MRALIGCGWDPDWGEEKWPRGVDGRELFGVKQDDDADSRWCTIFWQAGNMNKVKLLRFHVTACVYNVLYTWKSDIWLRP